MENVFVKTLEEESSATDELAFAALPGPRLRRASGSVGGPTRGGQARLAQGVTASRGGGAVGMEWEAVVELL